MSRSPANSSSLVLTREWYTSARAICVRTIHVIADFILWHRLVPCGADSPVVRSDLVKALIRSHQRGGGAGFRRAAENIIGLFRVQGASLLESLQILVYATRCLAKLGIAHHHPRAGQFQRRRYRRRSPERGR